MSRVLGERYELLDKIGDGGMAVVYKGRDRLLNRYVAIKILKPDYTKDIKFIESFRRESQAAASLSHPNIVNTYDVGREGNINFIVMELIEGQPLSDLIKEQGAFKPWDAILITKQIAAALSHAHKNHIIHRDIKPHNILITEDKTAKIADFGIAKAINAGTIVGNTGSVMGSVHYFSPEQARGGYVDEKSDIYSLGIVLYEMLTGTVPFDGDNPVTIAVKHMNEEIVPPSNLVGEIPPEVEAIVMKATDKYQINRYKSADEMLEALNQAGLSTIGVNGGYGRNNTLDATVMIETVNRGAPTKLETTEPRKSNKGEKSLKGKKRFKLNKVKLAAIILAVLCAIPASQLLLTVIEAGTAPEEVTVPDVSGLSVEEATDLLSNLGLELQVENEVTSSDYAEGLVVSQDPLAEMIVKTGKTVKVNVSKGMEEGTVPNLIGKTLSDAVFLLENYGYTKGIVSEEYSEMPIGLVIQQSPKAGKEAGDGTSISLVISLGEEVYTTTVPNMIGLDMDQAKAALEREGLALGEVNYAPSNNFPLNLVIDQSVEPGNSLESGSAIDLTLSAGPDEMGGTDVVEIPILYDAAKNEVFYLTVMVSDDTGVSTPINYEQRIKSNGSERFQVSGMGQGTVRIYFDNALIQEFIVDFESGVIL